MRRWTAVALVAALSVGVTACGRETPDESATAEPAAASALAAPAAPATTIDERLAAIASAQADLVNILQQRSDPSAQVLAAIADLNTRIDTLQREVDAIAADAATTTARTGTALNDLAASLRDVRTAVDGVSRAMPAAGTLTGLAANLNGLGTNVATLVAGVNGVAADVGALGPRIDAVAAAQADQAPMLATAAASTSAIVDLTAAFAAFRAEAAANTGTLSPQQQQALAASLAALNAQLTAIGFPTDAVPPAVAAAGSAAPVAAATPSAAPSATAAAGAAPVREGAFLAAPATAAPGATAAIALDDGRQLVETTINAANLTMSERAFDLVTGTTYVWRITAGDDYPVRLALPRLTQYAHVASITVDGTLVEFPPLEELDILEASVVEIEFTPIRPQVLAFEFLPQFGATFTDMNMTGTLTFR